jgi:molybdenum cofactor cytidylyltransferase
MRIAAIVLAAGLSRRMGRPKMVLPWGNSTIIGQVVATLVDAQIEEILVVTGGARVEVAQALAGKPVRQVFNPAFENGEMLESLQVGLKAIAPLAENYDMALVVLGDQPQIRVQTVREVCLAADLRPEALVVPSYQMRRGHPWVLPRRLWAEVAAMQFPLTLRDFTRAHAEEIVYVEVDTDSILMDLDTPEDYHKTQK